MVKRYTGRVMFEIVDCESTAGFVTYDDYKKLAEENERLRAEIAALRSVVKDRIVGLPIFVSRYEYGVRDGHVIAQRLIDAVPKTEETK